MAKTKVQSKAIEDEESEEDYKRIYKITKSKFIFQKGSKPKFLVGKPSPPPVPPGNGGH